MKFKKIMSILASATMLSSTIAFAAAPEITKFGILMMFLAMIIFVVVLYVGIKIENKYHKTKEL